MNYTHTQSRSIVLISYISGAVGLGFMIAGIAYGWFLTPGSLYSPFVAAFLFATIFAAMSALFANDKLLLELRDSKSQV